MAVNKLPKISALTGFAIGGWLLPLAVNFTPALNGFSLSLACFSSIALAVESRKESIVSGIKQIEKKLSLERVAYQLALSHEKELAELRSLYGFGDSDNDDDDYQPGEPPQAQIEGATLDQRTIAGGNGGHGETAAPGSGVVPFDFDWLLRSNSQHLLVTGATGSGKTTFIKWVLTQINPHTIKVYDPDFDGVTNWGGKVITAPSEDYSEIRANMRLDLAEFEGRTPNDPKLTKFCFVAEEMASLIPEGREDALKWLKVLLRRGRKRSLFIIGVCQDRNIESMGLKGAGLLNNFTILYLGGYAFDALDRIRDKSYRNAVRAELEKYSRPALVQFEGRFYPWDIPNLSAAGGGSGGGNAPAIPLEQSSPTIATLERAIAAPPIEATMSHWAVVDLSVAMPDQWLSVRETMRRIPALKTADRVKQMFQDLVALELGQIRTDGNRTLFKAFSPIV